MTDKKRLAVFFLTGVITGAFLFMIFGRAPVRKAPPAGQAAEKKPPAPLEKQPAPVGRFKIAIVLDDFGYSYKNVDAVFSLKRPITFSILPHLAYSKSIARRVNQKGYEAILHLPLEAHERQKESPVRSEVDTIKGDMKKRQVLDKLKNAIEGVPFCRGVSNHQGSRATENLGLMKTIFPELKNRGLFFLDSLVTGKSVCRKVAKDIGIKFGRRDVFLDNSDDFGYIRGQMRQLVKKARKAGSAIGIGHDRPGTVLALARLMPEAELEGAEFVFLSELVR